MSIYIPTRNRVLLLERALQSVFAQDYTQFEVIVVDDASQDNTPQLLESLSCAGKIRSFRFDQPRGAPAARNLAIACATHELVTGLDDDDEWLPSRLNEMLKQLVDGVGFVAASDIVELGNGKRFIARRPLNITKNQLLCRNVVGNQVLARRSDLLACGGFDETLAASQDYDLWIRLVTQAGAGVGITRPLQVIHAQANRARITTSMRRRKGVWSVYRKHKRTMNRAQRKTHLFNLIRTTDRPLSIRTALLLAGQGDRVRIAAHLLRSKGWLPDGMIECIARWRDQREIRRVLDDLSDS